MKILALLLLCAVAGAQTSEPKPVAPAKADDNGIVRVCDDKHPCLSYGIIHEPTMVQLGNISISNDQHGAVDVGSQAGRIVKLSDSEYAELQKLRDAVAAKEKEIAKAHGVSMDDPYPCPPYCATFNGATRWTPDRYEYRGQFLLVNVPPTK